MLGYITYILEQGYNKNNLKLLHLVAYLESFNRFGWKN